MAPNPFTQYQPNHAAADYVGRHRAPTAAETFVQTSRAVGRSIVESVRGFNDRLVGWEREHSVGRRFSLASLAAAAAIASASADLPPRGGTAEALVDYEPVPAAAATAVPGAIKANTAPIDNTNKNDAGNACAPEYAAYKSGTRAGGEDNMNFGPERKDKAASDLGLNKTRLQEKLDNCKGDTAFKGAFSAFMRGNSVDERAAKQANENAQKYLKDTTAWDKDYAEINKNVKEWKMTFADNPYNTFRMRDGANPSVMPTIEADQGQNVGWMLTAVMTDGTLRHFRTDCDLQPSILREKPVAPAPVPQKPVVNTPVTPVKPHVVTPVVERPVTPVQPKPVTPVQPKPEQPKPEQPKPEQPKPEQPKPEQPKPEQPKPEQPKPEQPKPEQPKPEQPKPEQPKPEQPKPEQPKPEQPKPEQPKPEQPKPEKGKDATKQPGSDANGKVEYGQTHGELKPGGTVTGRDGKDKPADTVIKTKEEAVANRQAEQAKPNAGQKTSGNPGEVKGVTNPAVDTKTGVEKPNTWTAPEPAKPANPAPGNQSGQVQPAPVPNKPAVNTANPNADL